MADRYDEDMFLGYVEGDLSPEQREHFEALMADDPRLRNLVAQIVHDRNALRAIPAVDPPASVRERPVEQLERGMLLGSVEPKRVATGTSRGRMFLPRLVTYGGLAAMLLLCVGLVINILTNQNIRTFGGPTESTPGSPVAIVPPENQTSVDDEKTVPPPPRVPVEAIEPPIANPPMLAPLTTNDQTRDPVSPPEPAPLTGQQPTAQVPAPSPQLDEAGSAPSPLIVQSMQRMAIPADQPLVVVIPPDAKMSHDPVMAYLRSHDGYDPFAAQVLTAPAMEQRLIVHSRDVAATVAIVHAWVAQANARMVQPTNALLHRTGVVMPTVGRQQEVQVLTRAQFEQLQQAEHNGAGALPPLVRAGDSYVMIIAMRADELSKLETHISPDAATAAMTRAPNTATAPKPSAAEVQGGADIGMQPAPADAAASTDLPSAGVTEEISLEDMVEQMVIDSESSTDTPPVAEDDSATAAANEAANVIQVPDEGEAKAKLDANPWRLLSVEVKPIAPTKSTPAVAPTEDVNATEPAETVEPSAPTEAPATSDDAPDAAANTAVEAPVAPAAD